MAHEEPLLDVAVLLADGTAVDWESAAQALTTDEDRQLLAELRFIADVAYVARGGSWGPLKIIEHVGSGTSGDVYRAWDSRLDREVALKILRRKEAKDDARASTFIEEGRLLARVRHPNVVTVYGAERVNGRIGVWMEFVHGTTLEEELRDRGSFDADRVIRIGVELSHALSNVHRAGLIHGDIKAQNVLCDRDGRLVLTDFGAGIELEETSSGASRELAGTPLCVAPEVLVGRSASPRTDLYSLAVLLYHLLTGTYPVRGRSLKEIRDAHGNGIRVPLHEARPDLPYPLVQIIERALDPDPATRHETLDAFHAELSALIRKDTSAASPQVDFTRDRWLRLMWIGGAAAVVALAIGLPMLLRSSGSPPAPSDWIRITNFGESATQPSLSSDGRMLTFIRGPSFFIGPGQIYVKRLPDGQPVQLTDDPLNKMSPVFSPDGSHVAYTTSDSRTFQWDTQVVPVQGTDPPRLLANASGLTWIDGRRLLFSEIKDGIHMALVTSTEDRRDVRDVYVPPHQRGMAHRSALSPDGRWVLAAEMENQAWLPCRLVPFDGRDRGKAIGPHDAPCIQAAWSPDGAWMYMNTHTGDSFHIWRQRFPDGVPEQLTFGPTEETGLAVASDGQSLITSVGITSSSVWIHDERGERQISSEGNADVPGPEAVGSLPRGSYFSPDDRTLYYLVRRSGGAMRLDGELWAADLASGHASAVLPGFTAASFDTSDDGTRIVFSSPDAGGKPRLWLGSLDGRFSPRQISSADDDQPLFVPEGEIIFRASEGGANFVYRMKEDGTGRRKVVPTPILALNGVSPDGRWVVAIAPVSGEDVTVSVFAYRIDGGPSVRVCDTCKVSWSRDGELWYLSDDDGRTYVIALRERNNLPDLPASGIRSVKDLAMLKVVRVIAEPRLAPGRDPGTYAFIRTTIQRNLYRIPLP